jgi:hypothetical protein
MDKLQAVLTDAPGQLVRYQAELDALDAVIPLHEVVVDPSVIKGKRPKNPNMLPWGNTKRHILNLTREENRPLFSDEIALHVARMEKIDFEAIPRKQFFRRIGKTLNNLFATGVLVRHHPLQTKDAGLWSLRNDTDR